MKLRGREIIVNIFFLFLSDEWGMKGWWGRKSDDDVICKHQEGYWHIIRGEIGEEGGYNIMGKQAFQDTIKSSFILEDGGRIIKWWCWWLLKWGTSWAWWLETNSGESRRILGHVARKKKIGIEKMRELERAI
jgi:hypothetical protein